MYSDQNICLRPCPSKGSLDSPGLGSWTLVRSHSSEVEWSCNPLTPDIISSQQQPAMSSWNQILVRHCCGYKVNFIPVFSSWKPAPLLLHWKCWINHSHSIKICIDRFQMTTKSHFHGSGFWICKNDQQLWWQISEPCLPYLLLYSIYLFYFCSNDET